MFLQQAVFKKLDNLEFKKTSTMYTLKKTQVLVPMTLFNNKITSVNSFKVQIQSCKKIKL